MFQLSFNSVNIYYQIDIISMSGKRVLIIGGVAAGASAAARLRRLDETAEITIIERSNHISYANCGLPYYVGDTIKEKSKLTLQSPQSFKSRFNIDSRVNSEALSIDSENKTVRIRDLVTGEEYDQPYDKLVLCPGAKAIVPRIDGVDDERVMTLRTVEDTLLMKEFILERKPEHAVVAGGGYIGIEIAENLIAMGVKVTLVQRPDQILPPFDKDILSEAHAHIRQHGVDLRLSTELKGIRSGNRLTAEFASGDSVETDMLILALGVVPDTELAKKAGLEMGIKGSIVVNEYMETSVPDIYAAGDAVQIKHLVTGDDAHIALAGPANRQGRIIADNICGMKRRYRGALGSSIIKIFDMTLASTGLNEKTAKAAGIKYDKVYTYSASNATYYPGANNMSVKVLFEPDTGVILGAQIAGFNGVDKRIDVFATAVFSKLTAFDLIDLDLAYAPPFASAKDPVNMAAYVITNVIEGTVKQYFWYELDGHISDPNVTVLDVRTDAEVASQPMKGVQHIPLDSLRERISEVDRSKPVYLMCFSGLRSYIGYRILAQSGYDCYNLAGGYRLYSSIMRDLDYVDCSRHPCGEKKE